MKKTLKIALACAFGASLVFVGCTKDFSSDINKLDSRVAALESVDAATRLGKLEQNVTSLQSALTTAEQAIGAANAKISDIEKNYATTASVDAKIKALESVYATKAELQSLKTSLETALNNAKTELTKAITDLGVRVTNAETAIKTAQENITKLQNEKASKDELKKAQEALEKAIADESKAIREKYDEAVKKLQEEKASKDELKKVKEDLEKADSDIIKRLNEEICPAITAVEKRATDLEGRMDDAEGNIDKIFKECIPSINNEIKGIKDRLDIVEGQIDDLAARVQTITASPCVEGDCEVVEVNFNTIDTAVVKMTFKVTPADAAAFVNPTLVVTSAQTRAAKGDSQYYAEYKPKVVIADSDNGFVTVKAMIAPIEKDNLKYWISLKHVDTDAVGEIEIISDPVEAIEGEPVALTGENLAWFRNGTIVGTDAKETAEYQILGENGPQLFTKVQEQDYTTVNEGIVYTDVFAGCDIRIKAGAFQKWINGIDADLYITLDNFASLVGAPAEAVEVTYPVATKTVYKPAETWTAATEKGAITPDTDPKKDKTALYNCSWNKSLNLNVVLAWVPAELYDETIDPNNYVNKINAVGTSLKFTVGQAAKEKDNGILIGGQAFKTLQASYRARLARHEETTPVAVNINEKIQWDYCNFNTTNGNPETPTPNAYFTDKTWLGAVSELNKFNTIPSNRIYKKSDAKKAAVADAAATFAIKEGAQKIVNIGINGVPYAANDVEYVAEWEETNINESGVSYNAYLTQIPFTVGPKHANVTCTYAPDAFVPSATNGGSIVIAKLVDDTFATAQGGKFDTTWLGTISKKEADIKDDFLGITLNCTKVVINKVGAPAKDATTYTTGEQLGWFTLTPAAASKSAIAYVAGKLNYGYTYAVTFAGTRYGVNFTYTVTLTTKTPAYQLETTAYVVDGNAPLEGQVINLGNAIAPYYIYDIQDAHFTKYLRVVNFDKSAGENLTINVVLTEVTAKAGKVDAQNCTGAVVTENAYDKTQGIIDDNVVAVWNRNIFIQGTSAATANYKGQQVKAKATLYDNGIEINSKEFTLTIVKPISIDGGVQNVVRVSANDKEINVLKNVKVTGILPSNYEYAETVDVLRPETVLPIIGAHWVTNSIETPSYGEYTNSLTPRYYHQQINTIATQKIGDMKVTLNGQPHSFSPQEATMEGYVLTLKKDNCEGVLDIEIPVKFDTAYGEVAGTAKIHVVQGVEGTESEETIDRIPE